VFPEEVEEVLKRHSSVRDAVAVGIPDTRFGETICGVVEAEAGATPTLSVLNEHVKTALAAYKAPRHIVVIDTIGRAPNGKVDYKRLKAYAMNQLGLES
jgi:fatty-acyl-CoA synthase